MVLAVAVGDERAEWNLFFLEMVVSPHAHRAGVIMYRPPVQGKLLTGGETALGEDMPGSGAKGRIQRTGKGGVAERAGIHFFSQEECHVLPG